MAGAPRGTWVRSSPVEAMLVVLAIPPILTNTYAGVPGVDPDVRDAARGMGMNARQVTLRVEAPIALPLILAGITERNAPGHRHRHDRRVSSVPRRIGLPDLHQRTAPDQRSERRISGHARGGVIGRGPCRRRRPAAAGGGAAHCLTGRIPAGELPLVAATPSAVQFPESRQPLRRTMNRKCHGRAGRPRVADPPDRHAGGVRKQQSALLRTHFEQLANRAPPAVARRARSRWARPTSPKAHCWPISTPTRSRPKACRSPRS